jgi:hypothetical protein
MNKLLTLLIAASLPAFVILFLHTANSTGGSTPHTADSPLNTSYIIENKIIDLADGRFETTAAPGAATKTVWTVFGEPVYGDLDGDDDPDAALFLVNLAGGSGTFYYIAGAIHLNGGYLGTNAVWLGDRVAVKDLRIHKGLIVVTYADRGPHEPMAEKPTVEKVMRLALRNGKLIPLKSRKMGNPDSEMETQWVSAPAHPIFKKARICSNREAENERRII